MPLPRHAPFRAVDRMLWDAIWLARHLAGERAPLTAAQARVERRLLATVADRPGTLREVPRVRALSVADFHRAWRDRAEPVVIERAAAGWPALARWSPAFFADTYGDDRITLVDVAVGDAGGPGGRDSTLREVVAAIEAGQTDYARFSNVLADHPELEADFDKPWLRSLADRVATGLHWQFFMGGAGTSTALHGALGSNAFVQVYGQKTWHIFPTAFTPALRPRNIGAPFFASDLNAADPDLAFHPLVPHLDGWTTTLHPGDVLYNPPFYWHQVSNPTTSIGVGFRWYGLPSLLRSSPTQLLLTLLATNPPAFKAKRVGSNFARVYSELMRDPGRS